MRTNDIISILRPGQWVKNVLVALPVFFGGRLFDAECWIAIVPAFISFSFMASSIYCLNDIHDASDDRKHPRKRFRPVASGALSPRMAASIMAAMAAMAIAVSWLMSPSHIEVTGILLAYFGLNVAYSMGLKRKAIVDVFIVASGFVLRLLVGGIATGILLSPWIVSMTFLLALFLAFAKRRDDVVLREESGVVVRGSIKAYNTAFLDQVLGIVATITIVCYIMYTVSPEVEQRLGSRHIYITSVFVLAGLLRYLQVTLVEHCSGSPTHILLHDRFIQGCIAIWLAAFAVILY